MLKKVKSIDICFENCEVAVIPIDLIRTWWINDVRTDYSYANHNECNIRRYAKGIGIVFDYFELLKYKSHTDKWESLPERMIKYHDITNIDIIYEDGTNDYIGVPWNSGSQFYNAYQQVKQINFGRFGKKYKLEIKPNWNLYKCIRYGWYLFRLGYYKVRRKFLGLPIYK